MSDPKFPPGPASPEEILGYLPHRDPFMFVDELSVEEGRVKGARIFPEDSWFFKGHFPHFAVVPGVLLVETMAQIGGCGVKRLGIEPNGTFFLAKIKQARFRRPVRPGERFTVEIDNIKATPNIIHQRGVGYVDGEAAVEAEWLSIAGGTTQ
ncbi:MAG: 3-hydroxyacyl-ACP dehydratase FabZ family protein [Rectinemataceae bacterium]